MINRKVIRIFILIFFIFLAYQLYRTEYNIIPNEVGIERAIEEYLDKDITILNLKKVDNTIAVYYDFGTNDSSGFTVLYRGINFRYQIRSAGYGSRNTIITGERFETNKGNYLAIIGRNYNNKATYFKFETYNGEAFIGNISDIKDFLIPFKVQSETYVENYSLHDNQDNDITNEMKKYLTSNSSYAATKAKAELFLLNIFCGIIILIGYAFSNLFKDKKQVSENE